MLLLFLLSNDISKFIFKVLRTTPHTSICLQKRHLNIHEADSLKLLEDNGVSVPRFGIAFTPEEAENIALSLGKVDISFM